MDKRDTNKRVVITGAGVLSPLGNDLATFCRRLHEGRVALRAVTYDAPGGSTTRMVAALDKIPLADSISAAESRFFSKLTRSVVFCAENATNSTKLAENGFDSRRAGVVIGSGFINLYDLEPVYETFFTGDERHLSPLVIPTNMASCPAGRLSLHYGLRGTSRTVSTACASSSAAIADAWRLIRDGSHDVVFAGDADLVCCTTLARSWERLRILCPATDEPEMACRPFDRDRAGLALGDGGAVFVLEELEHARARGATVLAEISGAFENSDAYDMLKPCAEEEANCMRGAITSGGLDAESIDMVQAHGTATQLNDVTEHAALTSIFGERTSELPIAAIKSMIGHTMGASGALATAAAVGSVTDGLVYPIPGFRQSDDGVNVSVSAIGGQSSAIRNVLVNAFGFGGANTCLVVSEAPA